MSEPTPTQEASREMAAAVFSDPKLREHFERMARATESRPAVRDDFEWLSSGEFTPDTRLGLDMDPEDALRVLLRTPRRPADRR